MMSYLLFILVFPPELYLTNLKLMGYFSVPSSFVFKNKFIAKFLHF